MNASINFLRQQQKNVQTQTQKDWTIAKYTMYGLIAYAVLVLSVLGVRIYFSVQRKAISTAVDQTKAQLNSYTKIEKDYVLFAKKVQLMYSLDLQREAKREAVKFFYGLIPSDDVILQVQLDAKTSKISFQVQTPDVFAMLNLLKVFQNSITKDVIYDMKIESVARKSDGTYTVSGSLSYDLKPVDKKEKS